MWIKLICCWWELSFYLSSSDKCVPYSSFKLSLRFTYIKLFTGTSHQVHNTCCFTIYMVSWYKFWTINRIVSSTFLSSSLVLVLCLSRRSSLVRCLVRRKARLRHLWLYPPSLNQALNSSPLDLKSSGSEQIHFNLNYWLYGMPQVLCPPGLLLGGCGFSPMGYPMGGFSSYSHPRPWLACPIEGLVCSDCTAHAPRRHFWCMTQGREPI